MALLYLTVNGYYFYYVFRAMPALYRGFALLKDRQPQSNPAT